MSADTTETTAPPVEETLAWEAEQRPRVATAAIVAGLLGVIGQLLFAVISSGGPNEDDEFISLGESVASHLAGHPPQGRSLAVASATYLGDHIALLTVSTICSAISYALIGFTLLFLHRATYVRSPVVGRMPYYVALVATFLAPLGHVLWQLPVWFGAAGFDGTTPAQARDALTPNVAAFGQLIEQLGILALAFAIVLVSLNAMRVGLLTRFFGILGIIAGVFLVVGGRFDPPGVIRAVWLIGTGLIIAGRIRVPPAWETGRAEPWPSQQQIRERRDSAAVGTSPQRAVPEPAPPEPQAPAPPNPARKKRKRRS